MKRRDEVETTRCAFRDLDSYVDLDGHLHLEGEDWHMQKLRVLLRDDFRCQFCKEMIDIDGGKIADVHHILKRSDGGPDDLKNLLLAHTECHKRAHPEKQVRWTHDSSC
jgi:5-methylcytosine-specific restriction endonuclease McrA